MIYIYRYLNLRAALPEAERKASIHFVMIPEVDESKYDSEVEYSVKCLQEIIELGRKARNNTCSMRIPLPEVTICHRDPKFLTEIKAHAGLIKASLNVRELNTSSEFDSLVRFEAKPDHRELGKQLLGLKKEVTALIAGMDQVALLAMEAKGSVDFTVKNGTTVTVPATSVKLLCHFSGDSKVFYPVTEGGCLLLLNKNPSASDLEEGLCREFTAKVQSLRKEAKLKVEDTVNLYYDVDEAKAPNLHNVITNRMDVIRANLRLVQLVAAKSEMPTDAHVHITCEAPVGKPAENVSFWITRA